VLLSAEVFYFPHTKARTSLFGMVVYNSCSLEVYVQHEIRKKHKKFVLSEVIS